MGFWGFGGALAASRARGRQLQSEINHVQAEQAAAAARRGAGGAAVLARGARSGALGPSGGWAIPYAIVLCESGGQNLPPNSAGASGYYQIIPSTWRLFGGTGPAAYLASKAEQDAVAIPDLEGRRRRVELGLRRHRRDPLRRRPRPRRCSSPRC